MKPDCPGGNNPEENIPNLPVCWSESHHQVQCSQTVYAFSCRQSFYANPQYEDVFQNQLIELLTTTFELYFLSNHPPFNQTKDEQDTWFT